MNRADPACLDLKLWLQNNGISGFEYIYWVIHFAFGQTCRYGDLIKVRAWTSEKWREPFLLYRNRRGGETKKTTRIQYEEALRLLKWLGPGVLLERQHELGALIRIEMAFRQHELDPGYDPMPVLKRFGSTAGQVLRGCPEFLLYVPALSAAMEADNAVFERL